MKEGAFFLVLKDITRYACITSGHLDHGDTSLRFLCLFGTCMVVVSVTYGSTPRVLWTLWMDRINCTRDKNKSEVIAHTGRIDALRRDSLSRGHAWSDRYHNANSIGDIISSVRTCCWTMTSIDGTISFESAPICIMPFRGRSIEWVRSDLSLALECPIHFYLGVN